MIVLAGDRTLKGAVTVIPCSSLDQAGNRWAHPLTTTIDGKGPSWAICDKITTVAVSRLSIDVSHHRPRRVTQQEFAAVLGLVHRWLPTLPAPAEKAPEDGTAPPDGEATPPRPAAAEPAPGPRPAALLATE